MRMSYRELLAAIAELSENELDLPVTVRMGNNEYFGVYECKKSDDDPNAPFDETHPILVVWNEQIESA